LISLLLSVGAEESLSAGQGQHWSSEDTIGMVIATAGDAELGGTWSLKTGASKGKDRPQQPWIQTGEAVLAAAMAPHQREKRTAFVMDAIFSEEILPWKRDYE
jgi:hypothetical protein